MAAQREEMGQGLTPSPLPYLTQRIPPAGGTVKASPEDFVVEEVPAYLPKGEGEFLYLWVEKAGHDTPWVASQLAKGLGIPPRDVSYAGLKDRHAMTRQWFCVPARCAPQLEGVSVPGVSVLESRRHTNKLRTGHLVANRFQLRLREVRDVDAAHAVLHQLSREGLPNFFGTQRFGAGGDNAAKGKALLLGHGAQERDRFRRRLFLSAYQSELFNRMLAQRMMLDEFARALLGDVMQKGDSGSVFRCESPEADQPRVTAQEIHPAGPMFGTKLFAAAGGVAEREAAVLAEEGLGLDTFRAGGGETQGARRAYRVKLSDLQFAFEGRDLRLSFQLPKGSYATGVLREIVKDESLRPAQESSAT
ncbi:MAG: tRNA pseudouridine(13) synthase TruD [Myxococcaceae bacterium]